MAFLKENISEKTTIDIKVVDSPSIPDYEFFVMINDFEKLVLAFSFFSFVVFLLVFFI